MPTMSLSRLLIGFSIFMGVGLIAVIIYLVVIQNEPNYMNISKDDEMYQSIINTQTQANLDWLHEEETSEELHHGSGVTEKQMEIVEYFQVPENTIRFLGVTILANDYDNFYKNFEIEKFNDDLFKVDSFDKSEVIKEMTNQISRNGKLQDIGILKEKASIADNTVEVETVFKYSDIEIVIPLELKMIVDDEHTGTESLYITTSVWDIIGLIEKGTEG